MIVDSSALLAIVLNEPDEERYLQAMVDADRLIMSAGNWLEAAIVVDNRDDPIAAARLNDMRVALDIDIVPVTHAMADLGRSAHLLYGKGRHPARLNYGDCFAYALSKDTGRPLLFKGADFAQTDIEPALKD